MKIYLRKLGTHVDYILSNKKLEIMLELRRRYIELKERAKQLMLKGEMKLYMELLREMEQMNLILVKVS